MSINRRMVLISALALITIAALPQTLLGSGLDDAADVRKTVRRVFDQMKSHQYDELYNSLSASSRSRITRQRFTSSMQRMEDSYQLERIEIGAVRVRGNTATVDTVIYGRVLKPAEGEGKIVAQQTLVREDGEWRVATGSPAAGLSNRNSRIYLKRDGRWIDVTEMLRAARQRRR